MEGQNERKDVVSVWTKILVLATIIMSAASIYSVFENHRLIENQLRLINKQTTPQYSFLLTSTQSQYHYRNGNQKVFDVIEVDKNELGNFSLNFSIKIINTGYLPIVLDNIQIYYRCSDYTEDFSQNVLPEEFSSKTLSPSEYITFTGHHEREYDLELDFEKTPYCDAIFDATASGNVQTSVIRITTDSILPAGLKFGKTE